MTAFLPIGTRIKFRSEKRRYVVRASDRRYAICTKPFAVRRTVLYTIVDFDGAVRGTENLIFCMGFETAQQCAEALARLQRGDSEISHRNRVPLDIESIER